LYYRLRRIEQTARRVELNDQTLCLLRLGFIDTSRNIARRRRTYGSIDFDETNLLSRDRSRTRQPKNQTC
jgi:hypothetical protein